MCLRLCWAALALGRHRFRSASFGSCMISLGRVLVPNTVRSLTYRIRAGALNDTFIVAKPFVWMPLTTLWWPNCKSITPLHSLNNQVYNPNRFSLSILSFECGRPTVVMGTVPIQIIMLKHDKSYRTQRDTRSVLSRIRPRLSAFTGGAMLCNLPATKSMVQLVSEFVSCHSW